MKKYEFVGDHNCVILCDQNLPVLCVVVQLALFAFLFLQQKTWHAMLTTKFKSERGKLKTNLDVVAARVKYSAKRKLLPAQTDESATEAKRCCRMQVITNTNYESLFLVSSNSLPQQQENCILRHYVFH